jgi:membrane peptidoglycan carboxypeptidase
VLRRNRVLELMKTRSVLTAGDYTTDDYDRAIQEPAILTARQPAHPGSVTSAARKELGTILCGPDAANNCPQVDAGGYTVITTLDWKLQRLAEKWTEAGARAPNAKDTAAYLKTLGIPYQAWIKNMRGSESTTRPRRGRLPDRPGVRLHGQRRLPLKGNKRFQPQFDVLEDGWRQPGSAFKPINYSIGIDDKTLTAASLFMDVVTDFGGGWTPPTRTLRTRPGAPAGGAAGLAQHPGNQAGIQIGSTATNGLFRSATRARRTRAARRSPSAPSRST